MLIINIINIIIIRVIINIKWGPSFHLVSLGFLLVFFRKIFLLSPVEEIVNFITQTLEQVLEQRPQIRVVGLVLELESSAVSAVLDELFRVSSAKVFNLSHNLLLLDLLVLLLDVSSLQVLPGQRSSQEVHEQVSQRLDIVSSTLLNSQVSAH